MKQLILASLVAGLFTTAFVRADVVECENGDRYTGKVLMVDEQNVKLRNEITGILTVPRSKVSTITFGKSTPGIARPAAAAPRNNIIVPSQPLQIDPAAVEQIQNQFLGDANPEANQMFQEMVRGLLSGKMDVSDIRAKAKSTLNDLKELQKDLGDDESAALLNGYASILEGFVNQAGSAAKAPANLVPKQAPKNE